MVTLIWDAPRQHILLVGGASVNATEESEVWDWDGTTWRIVASEGALAARSGAAVFPGPEGGSVIAFGGDESHYRGLFAPISADRDDFARLGYDNNRPYEICVGSFDNDQDGLAACDDPDCWVVCTPLCPPGATCDAADPHCGDGTCNAALENCRNCAADCACAAVWLNVCFSRDQPPTTKAAPITSSTLPMIEPTIDAFTTS